MSQIGRFDVTIGEEKYYLTFSHSSTIALFAYRLGQSWIG